MNISKVSTVLRENGYLLDGEILGVQMTPVETPGLASEFFKLELEFSDSVKDLPKDMIVKRPVLSDRGAGEALVYDHILRHTGDLPTMPCFGIVDDDPNTGLNFLFENLSATHHQTTWPVIPSLNECMGAVTALAKVHAHWWGRVEVLPDVIPPIVPHQEVDHLTNHFAAFADFVGEYLSADRRAIYEKVLDALDVVLAARLSAANSTLLHSDSHFWNFLYPNSGDIDQSVIFDWALWRTGLGGSDLAYMIALHLYPEHRTRFEKPLIDHYARVLNKFGVSYSREDVETDYRIGILIGLLMPIMEFSWKIPPDDWLPKLEKAFASFDDLKCQELME